MGVLHPSTSNQMGILLRNVMLWTQPEVLIELFFHGSWATVFFLSSPCESHRHITLRTPEPGDLEIVYIGIIGMMGRI